MSDIKTLEKRLGQIEMEIAEAEKRLGAHSVKPVLMAALLDLEDERDSVLEQIRKESGQVLS